MPSLDLSFRPLLVQFQDGTDVGTDRRSGSGSWVGIVQNKAAVRRCENWVICSDFVTTCAGRLSGSAYVVPAALGRYKASDFSVP